MRSGDQRALLAVSRSTDGGVTWDEPSPVTNAREHPADLTLLANGWVILFFGVRHEPFGVQVLVSKDNGRAWDKRRLIVCDDLGDNDLDYPSTVKLGGAWSRHITVPHDGGMCRIFVAKALSPVRCFTAKMRC